MEGRPLSHLELMTLSKKDEQYYSSWIADDLQELAQRIFGGRRWMQMRGAITVLSRLGYFAATSLCDIPTPGEEFCEAQVVKPNLFKKFLMMTLSNELQPPKEVPRSYARLLKDVHLVTFFLFGDFYELSKRVSNYFYMTPDTNLYQSKRMDYLYRLLGCMSLVKLFIDVAKETQQNKELMAQDTNTPALESNISEKASDVKRDADASIMCHLCYERRTEPTSTLCGHIFCWNCIHKWLLERNQCPICGVNTEPSRLIHLINFR